MRWTASDGTAHAVQCELYTLRRLWTEMLLVAFRQDGSGPIAAILSVHSADGSNRMAIAEYASALWRRSVTADRACNVISARQKLLKALVGLYAQ
jgi:hypothetical protein